MIVFIVIAWRNHLFFWKFLNFIKIQIVSIFLGFKNFVCDLKKICVWFFEKLQVQSVGEADCEYKTQ